MKTVYLHLGQNTVVRTSSIVGVFDLDNSSSSHITRGFLSSAEKAGQVVNVSDNLPKAFVLCNEDDEVKIYLSQLSSQTLFKRGDANNNLIGGGNENV